MGDTTTVEVTPNDGTDDGAAVDDSATVVNSPPVVTLTGAATANEGGTNVYTYTATDDDGDALGITEACGDNGTRTDTLAANHFECTFPDGPKDSTVSVTADDGEDTGDDEIEVAIANLPPSVTITSPAPGGLYAAGATIPVTASFTDPGTLDTHTCTINGSAGIVSEANGSGTCTGSVVASPGSFTITVVVTDNDGEAGRPWSRSACSTRSTRTSGARAARGRASS